MKEGLSTFLFALLKENGTYEEVKKLGGAIDYKETINTSDYTDYEDNAAQWSDTGFTEGELSLTTGDADDAVFAEILGRETEEITIGGIKRTIYTGGTNDIAKPVGFGFIERIRIKAGIRHRVKFYPNVTFKPFATEAKTKTGSKEYLSQGISGKIQELNEKFCKYVTVESEKEAIEILYALFGSTPPASGGSSETPGSGETPAAGE